MITVNVIGTAPQQQYVPLAVSNQSPSQAPAPLGSAANVGSLNVAARADHVHPITFGSRATQRNAALGFVDQAYDIYSVPNGSLQSITPTSQQVYGTLTGFFAGDIINNIVVATNGGGTGTPPTGVYLAVFSSVNASSGIVAALQVAITANLNTSAHWNVSGTMIASPLTAPYTIPSNGGYYLCLLVNGSWGTGQTTFKSNTQSGGTQNVGNSAIFSVKQTGQATMPSPASFVVDTTGMWFGWS